MDGFSNSKNSKPENENNMEEGFDADETGTTTLAHEKKTEMKTAGPEEEKVFHTLFGKRAGAEIQNVFKKRKMEEGNEEVAISAPLDMNQDLKKNVEDTKQEANAALKIQKDVAEAASDINQDLKKPEDNKDKEDKDINQDLKKPEDTETKEDVAEATPSKAKKEKPEDPEDPEEGEPEPVPVPEPEQKGPEPEPVPVPDPEPEQKEEED